MKEKDANLIAQNEQEIARLQTMIDFRIVRNMEDQESIRIIEVANRRINRKYKK